MGTNGRQNGMGRVGTAPLWTPDQVAFQEWLGTPKAERSPATQKALAEELGVSEKTLVRWKALPDFSAEVTRQAMRYAKARLPEIIEAMCDRAAAGDVPAAKLVFGFTGTYEAGQQQADAGESDSEHTAVMREFIALARRPPTPGMIEAGDGPN